MWPDEVTAAAKHALRKAGVTGNSLKALRMSPSDARKINDHMGGRLCELCGRSFLPQLHHYVLIFFFSFLIYLFIISTLLLHLCLFLPLLFAPPPSESVYPPPSVSTYFFSIKLLLSSARLRPRSFIAAPYKSADVDHHVLALLLLR